MDALFGVQSFSAIRAVLGAMRSFCIAPLKRHKPRPYKRIYRNIFYRDDVPKIECTLSEELNDAVKVGHENSC